MTQKEKHREAVRRYRRSHPEKTRQSNIKSCRKRYGSLTKDEIKAANLLKNYGLTLVDWNRMFDAQKGKCAICNCEPESKELFVDHSHETGQVRELLCQKCNTGLGMFRESREFLSSAFKYLCKHLPSSPNHYAQPPEPQNCRLDK